MNRRTFLGALAAAVVAPWLPKVAKAENKHPFQGARGISTGPCAVCNGSVTEHETIAITPYDRAREIEEYCERNVRQAMAEFDDLLRSTYAEYTLNSETGELSFVRMHNVPFQTKKSCARDWFTI